MSDAVLVVAAGASTAVGRDAWSSAAAVRAAVAGFQHHPFMIDSAGKPMCTASAPWLEPGLPVAERIELLLWPAIEQCLAGWTGAQATPPARLALALALPQARPGLPADIAAQLERKARERYRGVFSAIAVFARGHASGALALDAAWHKLGDTSLDACVVAGVDSYIDADTLEWVEHCDQYHGAGRQNNAWGFIPGEAAGALLLVREGQAGTLGLSGLAQVLSVGHAIEARRIKTETVCIGEGLSAAFRAALAPLPAGRRVSDIYCDMNGEPYRADEYGFTCLRSKEWLQSGSDFVSPADCWGDVGAASVPLHCMLALAAGAKGYANGSLALAWASSEGGDRGAVLLATRGRN